MIRVKFDAVQAGLAVLFLDARPSVTKDSLYFFAVRKAPDCFPP
jgi:hypothetical protein